MWGLGRNSRHPMETQGMDPGHCQGWAIQKQANEAQGHLIDIMGRLLSAPGLLHREGGGVWRGGGCEAVPTDAAEEG